MESATKTTDPCGLMGTAERYEIATKQIMRTTATKELIIKYFLYSANIWILKTSNRLMIAANSSQCSSIGG